MRGTRTESGTPTNKDLATGGYTAKTCEAIAAMTGGTTSQAKREAVPPQAGHGYMKMTTRAIGCSICDRTFNSLYWSFQIRVGGLYNQLPIDQPTKQCNRLKRNEEGIALKRLKGQY